MIQFTVEGTPQAQGSMRSFRTPGGVKLTSDNPKLKKWRDGVGWTAKGAMRGGSPAGRNVAIRVEVRFEFERPKRNRDPAKTTRTDLDKLLRALLDSLTGICYDDDSQVTEIIATKVYGDTAVTKVKVSEV